MPNRQYIQDLADQRFEGEIRNRFQEALDQIQDDAALDEIARAIEVGDEEAALRAAGLVATGVEATRTGLPKSADDAFEPMRETTRDAVRTGGRETVPILPARRQRDGTVIKFQFEPGNDRAVRRADNLHVNKIREVTDETREAIREEIREGINRGENPRDTARKIRKSIGLTRTQAGFIRDAEAELRSGDPEQLRRYLGRKLRDKRFDRSVLKAIRDETAVPEQTIQNATEGYRRKWVKQRSETIARDQSLEALTEGQEEALDQAREQGVVRDDQVVKVWVTARDSRVRDAHQAVPAMNRGGIIRTDQFQTPLGPLQRPRDRSSAGSIPSNVIQCRCSMTIRIKDDG